MPGIAVDPSRIRYGSRIYVPGLGWLTADDTGGAMRQDGRRGIDHVDVRMETHAAALRYVDSQFPLLTAAIRNRGPAHLLVFSDHGTLYGEEGFTGHRVGHPAVYTVPYAATVLA